MAYKKTNCTLYLHGQEDIYYCYLVRNTN